MDVVYLDNNATTPMHPAVGEAMRPYWTESYGNPASAHQVGRRARQALEDARERTAELLGADASEVIFTSGATEANNLAIFGLAGAMSEKGSDLDMDGRGQTPFRGRIVTSPLEHPSVAEPIQRLGWHGWDVALLPVDAAGRVSEQALAAALANESCLVSVMLANHEVGTLQPIQALAARAGGRCAFHCDAVQAAGKIPIRFHDLGVTTLSLSAHKFHGPKGVGALLVRRGARLQARSWGGHQQQGRRPGTEAVALAVGLTAALELAQREGSARLERVYRLRRLFLEQLRVSARPFVVNGPGEDRADQGLPHTLNVSFPGCRADVLLMNLDLAGVACSTGSACSSGSLLPAPVLKALGASEEVLQSSLRFSFSPLLSEAEVATGARRVAAVVERLRKKAENPERQSPEN